jgi:hypothetical protein
MIRALGRTMAPVLLLWLMSELTPREPQSGGYLIALSIISLAQSNFTPGTVPSRVYCPAHFRWSGHARQATQGRRNR